MKELINKTANAIVKAFFGFCVVVCAVLVVWRLYDHEYLRALTAAFCGVLNVYCYRDQE